MKKRPTVSRSEPCPYCKKPLHWRHFRKVNGIPIGPQGRPRTKHYEKIIELRKSGMSIRKIAKALMVSKGTVQWIVKDMEETDD